MRNHRSTRPGSGPFPRSMAFAGVLLALLLLPVAGPAAIEHQESHAPDVPQRRRHAAGGECEAAGVDGDEFVPQAGGSLQESGQHGFLVTEYQTEAELGDASFRIDILPKVGGLVVLHAGDEELPAEANILFDDEIVNYLPLEDVAVLAGLIATRLAKYSNPQEA